MVIIHSKKKIIWNLKYSIFLKHTPENVQPINYFVKWSRILFNMANVNHYVLLLIIWDFDLEFSLFQTFSYFWAFMLVSIKKSVSFTFLWYFKLKVKFKWVLSIFLLLLVWSWSIPYLTILALSPSFLKFPDPPLALFLKRNHPKKYQESKRFFFNEKQVFINWFL